MIKFLLDAAFAFVDIIGSGFIVLLHVITLIMCSLQKFYGGVIIPACMEGLADMHVMLIVFAQMYHECMCRCCACLSKMLLHMAKYSHGKSEQLISKYWQVQ